jgi:hypothetical protein
VIRHVALFHFVPGTSAEAIDAIDRALAELPGSIEEIVEYRFGRDLDWLTGNADYVVVADFASREDWASYLSDPRHVAVSKNVIAPVLETMTRVQFSW